MELMANCNLVASSTKLAPPRKHPQGQGTFTSNTGKLKQLDYILCDNKHMSNMLNCKARWSGSLDKNGDKRDHGLVHMQMRFRIWAHKPQQSLEFDREALKSEAVAKAYDHAVGLNLAKRSATDFNGRFRKLQEAVTEAAGKEIPPATLRQRVRTPSIHRGVSDEILNLIEMRRRQCQGARCKANLRTIN